MSTSIFSAEGRRIAIEKEIALNRATIKNILHYGTVATPELRSETISYLIWYIKVLTARLDVVDDYVMGEKIAPYHDDHCQCLECFVVMCESGESPKELLAEWSFLAH